MILAKSDTPTPEPLKKGDRIYYITNSSTSFRLGTVVSADGFRVGIVLDCEPNTVKRVRPWNVRRAE